MVSNLQKRVSPDVGRLPRPHLSGLQLVISGCQAGVGGDTPMLAMTINLKELKSLLAEFIAERGGDDSLMLQLTLSDFLLWVQTKARLDAEQDTDAVH